MCVYVTLLGFKVNTALSLFRAAALGCLCTSPFAPSWVLIPYLIFKYVTSEGGAGNCPEIRG